ncbi:MAG: hypothetical protein KBS77_00480 [Bacteroidales bacterium]|nr:hypothetical protein [Candidatus Colicola faecequi]
MNRHFLFSLMVALLCSVSAFSQNIPEPLEYTEIYDFIDELTTDGIISVNTAIKPYTRNQIAGWLREAALKSDQLNKRQNEDLAFYMQDFALELDTIPDYKLWGHKNVCQWTNRNTFNLSLVEPAFHYATANRKFKMSIKPILGMDIYASKKGMITKRWYGAEMQMDIANHVSVWGSLRDNSWKGTGYLKEEYFPDTYAQIDGAKLTKGQYLNNLPGLQYKEANYGGDFSDSRGGISLYSWFGSISLQRERIQWGDAYHSSNILSAHNPAVPMFSLNLRPCRWFEFNYFHAWLVSNVLDSTRYYSEVYGEGETKINYRPYNKFMAANMFTFRPLKQLEFSFGNSVVYAENNIQAAYLIPIAFYKSLDHLLTKGVNSENQNSQVFATISVRPVEHLHLYTSLYIDEFKGNRLKKSNPQNNPMSYLVGFNWSGWPLRGLSLKGEFMRSYIATYNHSIAVLDYTSNSYNMGHYMGGNAQSIFAEIAYRPVRGLSLKINYTCDTKYNLYDYIRGGDPNKRDEYGNREGIGQIISYKPFADRIWQNDKFGFLATYEIFNNCYAQVALTYNNARAYSVDKERAYGEDRGWNADGTSLNLEGEELAAYYLNKFSPVYYQGKNFVATMGLSFRF